MRQYNDNQRFRYRYETSLKVDFVVDFVKLYKNTYISGEIILLTYIDDLYLPVEVGITSRPNQSWKQVDI